jgi:nucleoside-diphosphate-sugar epimerase
MRDDHVGGLSNVLAALARAATSPSAAPRIIYVSTTGVYGQNDGRWVDERAACEPATEGGRAHLAAEELLRSSPLGKSAIILRMAGIYGPQRIPRRDDLAAGRPISAPREGYVNLIHVDDAADAVVAADAYASPPRTYQVSDGHPIQRRDYLSELARLIGAPPPRFVDSVVDSSVDSHRERGAASKRISNARLLAELPVRLAYPSYRQGLAAIVGRG